MDAFLVSYITILTHLAKLDILPLYIYVFYKKYKELFKMATTPQPQQPQQPQQPVAPNTPYEQQPVSQQYFAQPQAAPVQYVVAAKSLKGKGGWLAFFMIIAGIASLSYAAQFINSFNNNDVMAVISSRILFAFAIAAVILIALEKKIAKWVYIAFWAASLIFSLISGAVAGADATTIATAGVIQLVILVFVTLYFLTSKRVKETLIK